MPKAYPAASSLYCTKCPYETERFFEIGVRILPQVGRIESGIFPHFGFIDQFVLDAWQRFMS
jgi:hypothetical protein